MSINILKYESDIWKTADLLRGASFKQSDFPKYMMPFFALLMVESRLIREADRLEKEVGREDIEDFIEMFRLEGLGYNDFVIRKKKTLKDICKNDKAFDVDFHSYLKAFDVETKYLLGVDKGTEEEKFLDISGIAGQLKKKRILFDTVKAWSEIDLTPFNNSEITTLEEHIKRKWADISAETAGEQYTPDDIISLMSEIIATKIEDNGKFLTLYDPTCGGGNLLFGTEDKIQEIHPNRPTATYGQEWNDTLYALAKIESRFRKDTQIEYGNTLTDIGKFWDKQFNVIVANPPYGEDWKGFEKDIKNDTTERFVALPSIADGQLLFTQHILHKLADDGLSIVVHNGTTLFSGDAGSGESTIRKHIFDNDWVEAIIQLPTDEFFNTNIYTYLWIFNKNKPADRKDKVLLINACELYVTLTKSKGKKRKEMDLPNRNKIVQALTAFKDNEFSKVFDKWQFYYNKQAIMLTNIDENGKAIEMPTKTSKDGDEKEEKSIKLTPTKISQVAAEGNIEITDFDITTFDKTKYTSLEQYFDEGIKPLLGKLDYKNKNLTVFTKETSYYYDEDKDTIIEQTKKDKTELGCGKIVIKASLKKDSKTKKPKSISITTELTQDLQKDYETIPYSPDEAINQRNIADFMAKYITKPFQYLDNIIGVEVVFCKLFHQPEIHRDIKLISEQLELLNNDLADIENDIYSKVLKGLNTNIELKDSGIEWLGKIPAHWEIKRFKDVCYNYTTGGTPNTSNPAHFTGKNTWVTIADIGDDKFVDSSSLKLTDEAIKLANIPITPTGSLLYSFKLTLGKIAFAKKDLYTNEAIISIFPNKHIDLEYHYYMLPIFLLLNATENIYGAKMLNQKLIANAIVLHPPKKEQTEIAKYLEIQTNKLDGIVSNISKQMEVLKELRRTLINEVITGNVKDIN